MQDQVGVVGHVATGRAQVDDRPRRRGGVAEGMDVGHHVVPEPALVGARRLEVDVVDLRAQLGDLRLGDLQAELALRLGQRDPEPSPGRDPAPAGPEPAISRLA